MQQSPSHHLTAAASLRRRLEARWQQLSETAETRQVAALIFLFSMLVLLAWRLFVQMEVGDAAIWDYVAQAIRRGQIPYRDVVEIKGPASAYLSALAMGLGHAVGVRDVMAVRFMQLRMTGRPPGIIYLLAQGDLGR